MTISDWLAILAIILAPLIAVHVQRLIEEQKEKRTRKMHIFKALMATRATPVSPLHVEALNMIDIEFYKNREVVQAWKLLLDNFANYPKDTQSKDFEAKLASCSEKSNELLTDLLHEMSKSLNYDFDKVQLKRGCYIPKGHGEIELEQRFIRRGVADLLLGIRTLPIKIVEEKNENNPTA